MNLFENRVISNATSYIQLRSLERALTQYDWFPYKNYKDEHKDRYTGKPACADGDRRQAKGTAFR